MKLKVTKEGREDIFLVKKDDLIAWMKAKKFDQVHNFVQGGPAIIGADHDIESVLEDIEKAERLAVLVGSAQSNNMGHAVALIISNRLEMYDVGPITTEDLDIT